MGGEKKSPSVMIIRNNNKKVQRTTEMSGKFARTSVSSKVSKWQ